MTQPGARPYTTVSPPSTACIITPSGSRTPRSARSRRNGVRKKAISPAAPAAMPTKLVSVRLPNSISAWLFVSATRRPLS